MNDMPKSQIQKFIEAGMQFTEVSRKQAEAFVQSLVKSGEVRRKDAEQLVQTLVDRGRETTESVAAAVQAEIDATLLRIQSLDKDDSSRATLQEHFDYLESLKAALVH